MNHNLPRAKWTLAGIKEVAKKYKTMDEWREGHQQSYKAAQRKGLHHEVGASLGLVPLGGAKFASYKN